MVTWSMQIRVYTLYDLSRFFMPSSSRGISTVLNFNFRTSRAQQQTRFGAAHQDCDQLAPKIWLIVLIIYQWQFLLFLFASCSVSMTKRRRQAVVVVVGVWWVLNYRDDNSIIDSPICQTKNSLAWYNAQISLQRSRFFLGVRPELYLIIGRL